MEKEKLTKNKRRPANSIHEKIVTLWKEKIKDLNLARQRIGIYPESHPEVVEAVKKVAANFKELLSLKEEITLGVFQDKLLINGKPLELEEEEEEFQKEFALCLHRRGVANLTFSLGLKTKDIYKFLKIIATDPKTITKQGGIAQLFLENELIYIRINEADYRHILHAKAKDLSPQEKTEISDIANYLAGKISKIQEKEEDMLFSLMNDPQELADLISDASKDKSGDYQVATIIAAINRINDLAKERAEDKINEKLAELITNLEPHLQAKLFEMEESASLEEDLLKKIVPHLSKEAILGILELVLKEKEKEVSLSQVLSRLVPDKERRKEMTSLLKNELLRIGVPNEGAKENLEEIEKSLSGEEEDKYIPEEYKEKLSALKEAEEEYSEEEVEKIGSLFCPIDEEGMARGKILTLVEMLILEKEEKERGQMIDEAAEAAGTLVNLGQYKTLGQVFETLRIAASPNKENIFYQAIDRMSLEIIDTIISALYTLEAKSEREEVFTLLSHLSRKAVLPLMDRLSKEEDKGNRLILISAVTALENDSAKEVVAGLDDPKWYVVRNTVHILRQVKDKTRINALLKPLRHQETRVRLETIEALGELGDPEVLSLLVLGLKDEDRQIRELSLRYLVAIGGERSVATLLRILKSSDYKLKVEAISALGEIGSPRAVGELALILKSFTLWGIGRNNRLRASAARALGKIGGEEAVKALGRGARFSFSRLVKRACLEALKELRCLD